MSNNVQKADQQEFGKKAFKFSIFFFFGIFGLMFVVGFATFYLSVRGEEETLVPDIRGKEIVSALVELQDKELYPRVEERHSSKNDKGIIIDQLPFPGSVVKAGRRVLLIVSKGPIINRVPNYTGQNIDDVKISLQTLFSSSTPLLKIKEPVMSQFDSDKQSGTILEQKPEPGSTISGTTFLEFVVSRGPRGELVEVDDYMQQRFEEVILELTDMNMPFVFSVREAEEDEEKGIIVSQSPEQGAQIPFDSVIQLVMTHPAELEQGTIFGLFKHILPDYTILVDIRLDAVTPAETRTIFSMKHTGGPLLVPYIVEEDAELVFYIFDKEEIRKSAEPERSKGF